MVKVGRTRHSTTKKGANSTNFISVTSIRLLPKFRGLSGGKML